MTTTSAMRVAGPSEIDTRARLREAQTAESAAVTAVFAAQQHVRRARGKRDALLVQAQAVLDRADEMLRVAEANLVAVSGVQRAAVLLGVAPARLRKSAVRSRSTS